jgi:DnaJ-class molecular chaperone
MREECPKCGGQGRVLISEVNTQYDRTLLDWKDCRTCGGAGSIEIEEEDDE